jgi:hypothetical protein
MRLRASHVTDRPRAGGTIRRHTLRAVLIGLVALAAGAVSATTAAAVTISPSGVGNVQGRAYFQSPRFAYICDSFVYYFGTTAGTYAPGDVFATLTGATIGSCDVSTTLETRPGEQIVVGPVVGGQPTWLLPVSIRVLGCRFTGTVTAVTDVNGRWDISGQVLAVDTSDPLTSPTCLTWPGPLTMRWSGQLLPGWTTTLP